MAKSKSTSSVARDAVNAPIRRSISKVADNMAHRVAAFDWAQTSTGALIDWPESLRTAVNICLGCPVPTFVWWGSELINIYNDAYAPLLGRRHPSALGMPARKVWPSVWPTIAKDVDAVMHRGASIVRQRVRIVMKRKGFPDEMYFTYTFSPIPLGDGRAGGIFQIAADETAHVVGERESQQARANEEKRLKRDKDHVDRSLARWQAVIANMPEGIILADAEGHLLDWNRAALIMHGYTNPESARVHLSTIAADFEVTNPNGSPIPFSQWPMSRLLRGETFRNQEAHVHQILTGKNVVLIYNGTLIRDPDGQIRFALLTLHDKTEFRATHTAALKTPKQTAVEAANFAESLLYDMDLTFGEREFCKSLGQHLVQEAIDVYLNSFQKKKGYEGSCIAASLAIAMIIVNDL